jgi:phosphohistidine phosphatase
MKQILLMRHAKSSWEDEGLSDFERPLAGRGKTDAPMMCKFIRALGYTPECVYSSPATRAKETILQVAAETTIEESAIQWDEDLYYGDISSYLQAIQSTSSHLETIMLVGHNPLMENTAGLLCGADNRLAVRMPTAAVVCLESYAASWKEITAGTCQIKWMMIPKALKNLFTN